MDTAASFPSLKDKRVLVTGASSGIGAAAALAFGRQGAVVGVHYRSGTGKAQAVAAAVQASGAAACLLQADLTLPEQRDSLVPTFVAETGGIDVLVNNAGAVLDYEDFLTVSEESLDHSLALNAKAPLMLARAAWPVMETAGGGRIVNISSASVRYGGSRKNVHYLAGKSALEGITVSLAKAGAASNILVNAVRPGVVDTGMRHTIAGYSEEQWRHRLSLVPLGRAASPGEIAATILFLASAEAGFITGQIITVAGGD